MLKNSIAGKENRNESPDAEQSVSGVSPAGRRADRLPVCERKNDMSVYVDNAKNPYIINPSLSRKMKMCHMLADIVEELHAMCDALGLKRKRFQGRMGRTLSVPVEAVERWRRENPER